jgi:hypothetical protein
MIPCGNCYGCTQHGGGYQNIGCYPLHRFSLNAGHARGQGRIPTSPLASSLAFLSPVQPCPPSAVPPSVVTRSRKGARRRTRCQGCRLLHLGSTVARRGAATGRPWRPLRRWPLPLLPLPSRPRQLGLLAMRPSRRNGGPAVRRGVGGKLLPQRLLLLRHPAVTDGHRAARTRRPLLPSGPLPPLPRGPA